MSTIIRKYIDYSYFYYKIKTLNNSYQNSEINNSTPNH